MYCWEHVDGELCVDDVCNVGVCCWCTLCQWCALWCAGGFVHCLMVCTVKECVERVHWVLSGVYALCVGVHSIDCMHWTSAPCANCALYVEIEHRCRKVLESGGGNKI